MSILPTWDGPRDGSGCDNPDCSATNRWVTVASRREIDAIFPRKDRLDFWPLPDQATHVCTVCGFVYQGISETTTFEPATDATTQFDADDWEFDTERAYTEPLRDAADAFVTGAPDGASVSQIADGITRTIPGVDHAFARTVLEAHDLLDTETDA